MIRSNNGEVTIKGCVTDVAVDFTVLRKEMIRAFKKAGMEKKEAEELVHKSFELAFKSEKEIRDETLGMMADLLKDLIKEIKEVEEEE